jgi:hypothetical protein
MGYNKNIKLKGVKYEEQEEDRKGGRKEGRGIWVYLSF